MGKGDKRRICQIPNTQYQDNWDLAFIERRPIPHFPGYWILKNGRVWSEPRLTGVNKTGQFLKQGTSSAGYPRVKMFNKDSVGSNEYIHRLLLTAFVGPCPNGMEGCHNSGDPGDYDLGNLRWDTRSNNIKDAYQHGKLCTKGEQNPLAKLNTRQVRVIRHLLKYPKEFTQKEIGEFFNVSSIAICDIKKGRTWNHAEIPTATQAECTAIVKRSNAWPMSLGQVDLTKMDHPTACKYLVEGMKVKVLRRADNFEANWNNCWVSGMDNHIGETHEIENLCGLTGVALKTAGGKFPAFCLQIIEPEQENEECQTKK